MHRTREPSNPDTPEILDRTHVALRHLALKDEIAHDVYCKNLVALAARWILIGRPEDASAMVCELPLDYVSQVMPSQMETDEHFRKIALRVSMTLSAMPMDLDDDDVQLTMLMLEKPKAQA